jgi:hypothetical protein
MKLQTQVPLHTADNQIGYQSQLLILGSCFAENIGSKLDYFKFQTLQNPYGILFHPIAIERLVLRAIQEKKYTEEDIFFLNERWHCFDAHSDLSDASKEKILQKLNEGLVNLHQQLVKSTHILITLGTAWVYKRNSTASVVANCHKVPQKEFSKELFTVGEIRKSLKNTIEGIQIINKNAEFIFTVSPVRHLKDGFVENQRSKSHLITAIQNFLSFRAESKNISYFPSYEIMMDELRDYRFYEADMIHPNKVAVDYIWEKFLEVWLLSKAHPVMEKVDQVQKGIAHRPFNSESEQHQIFLKSIEKKIAYLQEEYPYMKFNK